MAVALDGIIGQSAAMRTLSALVLKVAPHDCTVLICGESGTGKELIARAIKTNSKRASGPFVTVNCGAMPETLTEALLFGHERGSFTGASSDKRGLFEAANGGTIFLDEVGEMPLPIQVKLLRALQEREIVRLGSTKSP
jgi:transcriptional regulator with PAS, ATPase and Fis domain